MSRPLVRPGDDDLAQSLASLSIATAPETQATPSLLKVFYHAACLHHRFTRPDFEASDGRQPEAHDASIVERPERLRAVLAGVHAAMARHPGRIMLQTTEASLSLSSTAFKTIHGPLQATDESDYARALSGWLRHVQERHDRGKSEIPSGYSQSDLYLAAGPTGSQMAIEGALGASCQAVDEVCQSSTGGVRFVACRPPGHHCGRDSPSGFCFVNNVAVALQHAHQNHEIDRVVIFDIDLHHGNGTQSLVWDINSQAAVTAARMATPANSPKGKGKVPRKRPLKVFYGSLHDILSFPCETGDPQLVANASVRLAAHDQHICNVHIKPYNSAAHFHTEVYPTYQADLFGAATQFCKATSADPTKTLIVISAGMDACELEYTSMSRHHRRVPVSFYNRFARDVMSFAADPETFAPPQSSSSRQPVQPKPIPRVVSILEGGYSDAALMSGTASLLQGLSAPESEQWFANQLEAKDVPLLDKACCVNPPPPNIIKRIPPWALAAGEQLCLFLSENREEWNRVKERQAEMKAKADQLADPNGPRALRERKEPKKYAGEEMPKTRASMRQRTPQATPQKKPAQQAAPPPPPPLPTQSLPQDKPARARPWDNAGVAPVVLSETSLHPSAPISEAFNFDASAHPRTQAANPSSAASTSASFASKPVAVQPSNVPLPESPAPAGSTSRQHTAVQQQEQPQQPSRGLQTVKAEGSSRLDWPMSSTKPAAPAPKSLSDLTSTWTSQSRGPPTELPAQKPTAAAPSNNGEQDAKSQPAQGWKRGQHVNTPSADETRQTADDLFMKSVASLQQQKYPQTRQGGEPAAGQQQQQPQGETQGRGQVKFTWQGSQLGQ